MSAVLNTPYVTFAPLRQVNAQNQEGDWDEYLFQTARYRSATAVTPSHADLTTYKRERALAYLGKRAQLNGGACNYTTPRILTTRMIAALEASNRMQRYNLYPWMEALTNLVAEIEAMQDAAINPANVIPMLPATKYYRNNPRLDARRLSSVGTPVLGFSSRGRTGRRLSK
jgi:hypothetical protein